MNSSSKVLDFVRKYTMIIALVLVTVFFTVQTGGKLVLPSNVNNLIAQNAYVFVLATGMLLCILTGGNIDLSVGSIVCFVGALSAVFMINAKIDPILAVLLCFLIGTVIGAWQAFWIAYVRIPPFIVTLSGMLIFRGLSNVVLKNGMTISVSKKTGFMSVFGGGANCYFPDYIGDRMADVKVPKFIYDIYPGLPPESKFNITCLVATALAIVIFVTMTVLNRKKRQKKEYEVEKFVPWCIKLVVISLAVAAFGFSLSMHKGIPSVLLIILGVVIIYSYITSNTRVGRYFYAVGGNEKATKLSGINTNKVYFLAYTNMGLLSALAGLITVARLTTATAQSGQSYEMDAIASCFIGGASAYGGIGTVPGVIIGALLMGVINLGMNTMKVDQNMQQVVKGLVLLAAVIFDVVSKRGGKLIAKNT